MPTVDDSRLNDKTDDVKDDSKMKSTITTYLSSNSDLIPNIYEGRTLATTAALMDVVASSETNEFDIIPRWGGFGEIMNKLLEIKLHPLGRNRTQYLITYQYKKSPFRGNSFATTLFYSSLSFLFDQ